MHHYVGLGARWRDQSSVFQVVHRQEILFEFWNNDRFFTGRSLDVFISRLRKYLMEDPNIKIINVRGVGYKMVV